MMVLILPPSANVSRHVMREVERAVDRGLPIIVLRLEPVVLSPAMEYLLSAPQWLDGFPPPFEPVLDRLSQSVGAVIASPGPVGARMNARRPRDMAAVVRESGLVGSRMESVKRPWHERPIITDEHLETPRDAGPPT